MFEGANIDFGESGEDRFNRESSSSFEDSVRCEHTTTRLISITFETEKKGNKLGQNSKQRKRRRKKVTLPPRLVVEEEESVQVAKPRNAEDLELPSKSELLWLQRLLL